MLEETLWCWTGIRGVSYTEIAKSIQVQIYDIYVSTYSYVHCTYLWCLEKAMAPTPVLLPGRSHGWRSLGRLQSMGS